MTRDQLTTMLEATMNALAAGIFLVGADGRVLFANRIAESFARNGGALRINAGRLTPTDRTAALAFNALLAAPEQRSQPIRTHHTIALPRPGGGGLVARISLLDPAQRPCQAGDALAVASIIVQDPELCLSLPGEAFAQLYCLTAAELRVALAMVPGARPQSAAEALGISSNTVKTHLQRIFEKTDTSRQADLIALMLRTTPPVVA